MGLVIFFLILFGLIAATIAYSKNRNWFGWGILGILIGIFAVIWIACLPKLEN